MKALFLASLLAIIPLFLASCQSEGGVNPTPPAAAMNDVQEDTSDLFDMIQTDRPPIPRSQVRPVYPTRLRERGATGEALVDFIVDRDGSVRKASCSRATHPAFAQSAVECVRKWRFKPALKDGNPVRCRMRVPIIFSIMDVSER